MTTVCKECRLCRILVDSGRWVDYLCTAEAFAREAVVCSVTGRRGYAGANSLGMTYVSDDQEPFCRDVNTGTCEHFVRKPKLAKWYWPW